MAATKLPILVTIRGEPEYGEFLRDLSVAEGAPSVADLIERGMAALARKHRLTPPVRVRNTVERARRKSARKP